MCGNRGQARQRLRYAAVYAESLELSQALDESLTGYRRIARVERQVPEVVRQSRALRLAPWC